MGGETLHRRPSACSYLERRTVTESFDAAHRSIISPPRHRGPLTINQWREEKDRLSGEEVQGEVAREVRRQAVRAHFTAGGARTGGVEGGFAVRLVSDDLFEM